MGSDLPSFAAWDRALFNFVNHTLHNDVFDALMPILSDLTLWLIPLGAAWILFMFRTNRTGRIVALFCFVVVAATDQLSSAVLKPLAVRTRPCNVVPETHFYRESDETWITTDKFGLTTYKPSYSFPSSHAANMAGQAAFWAYFYPAISPLLVIAAVAVGFSRIYLGFHWPFDVFGGYLLGIVVALVIAYLLRLFLIPREGP